MRESTQHQTVLPEYSDFTETVPYLRLRKQHATCQISQSPSPNENYSARWNIKSRMCQPSVGTRREWSPVSGVGKEWSTPADPTVCSHPLLPDSALLSSVLTAAVASMFSMLIFKTIPRVRTHSIAGLLQPWTAAWERYFRPKTFHITVAKLRQMRTLLKSSNAMRPSPRSHASNVVEGECATAVDRGGRHEFECYWNLLMLDFWYHTVHHVRTLPKVMPNVRMSSTVDGVWTHANTCEGVSENAALILDCWPLHTAERFGTVYRIVSYPSFSPGPYRAINNVMYVHVGKMYCQENVQ